MSQTAPFQLQGKTIKVVAAVSPPTGIQAPTNDGIGGMQYLVTVVGTQTVWLGWGNSPAAAQAAAVIPAGGGGSSTFVIPIPASATGVQVAITAPANSFFSAATAANTSDVYVSPGEGI